MVNAALRQAAARSCPNFMIAGRSIAGRSIATAPRCFSLDTQ